MYVKPTVPDLPGKPVFYDVKWGQGNYCLDEQNAKNLLKNKLLSEDYEAQLEAILKELK